MDTCSNMMTLFPTGMQQHLLQHLAAQYPVDRGALVDNALNVLSLEAGLSEETMATLRHAVQSGMARKIKQERAQDIAVAAAFCASHSNHSRGGPCWHLPPIPSGMTSGAHETHYKLSVGASPAQASSGGVSTLPVVPLGYMPVTSMMARSVKPSSSKRQQLTVGDAAEIYSLRPCKMEGRCLVHCRSVACSSTQCTQFSDVVLLCCFALTCACFVRSETLPRATA